MKIFLNKQRKNIQDKIIMFFKTTKIFFTKSPEMHKHK